MSNHLMTASQISYGWTSDPNLIEMVHARFTQQQFQPHSHDTWSLCAVISGVKNIALPSESPVLARAGDVYLLQPEQAHAGCSVNAEPCEYAMLHISRQEWQSQAALRGIHLAQNGMLPKQLPQLSKQVAAFVLAKLAQQLPELNWEQVCDAFFGHYQCTAQAQPCADQNSRVSVARDYLRSNWSKPVPLIELSRQSALSGFELTRRFRDAYGLPPHRYQLAMRVMHAKNFLLQGLPIAEVASATGFADQSHLGRVFKAMLGMTPGMLARKIETPAAGSNN